MSKDALKRLIEKLAIPILLATAAGLFYFGFSGITDGAVQPLSKSNSPLVRRADSPFGFWYSVTFWLVGAGGCLWVAWVRLTDRPRR